MFNEPKQWVNAEILRWNADKCNKEKVKDLQEITIQHLENEIFPYLVEQSKNGRYSCQLGLNAANNPLNDTTVRRVRSIDNFDNVDVDIEYLTQLLSDLNFNIHILSSYNNYGYLEVSWDEPRRNKK